MNSNAIIKFIVLVCGLLLAVVMGNMLVTDTMEAFTWIAGISVVVVTVYLERRIWLLIPFLGALEMTFRVPSQPSSLLLGQFWFLGFALVLFLMRKLPFRPKFTEMEFWFLVLVLFVLQAYIRNPVGLNVFGGSSVGGKPYFLFGVNLLTAIVLGGLSVPPKELKYAVRLSIVGGLLNLMVSVVGTLVPSVGFWFGAASSTGGTNYEDVGKSYDAGAANRIGFLGTFSKNASLWLATYVSPLKACIHPLWAALMAVTIVSSALSGFRNAVATVALTYLVGLAYRGGMVSLIISGAMGLLAMISLSVGNMIVPFPPNIQRALSFLPGTWEQRYVQDAEGSSEWRFEIWREVLTTDRYIRDKWFGDGLGFSSAELQHSLNMAASKIGGRGISGFDEHRESILVSGDYHSGPVQTIRIIGYVGLFFLLIAQIRLAVLAHRQILRCRNTEWFPVALFICIPLIWYPVFWVFIFGDFKGAAATLLLGGAMVRMLQNNLPIPAYEKRKAPVYAPVLPKTVNPLSS